MESTTTTITIQEEEGVVVLPNKEKKKQKISLSPITLYLRERIPKDVMRKLLHSVKVGIAMVLVSLLYLLSPLYNQVGDNAMWAIMTVVVVFEFFAGATLSKGLNRGLGTILGGGLGCLAAALAQEVGGIGNTLIVATSLFVFGTMGTYCRQVTSIKKRYDYGAMIFILTFNLIAVSGLRAERVMQLAKQRLLTIALGFAVCLIISLLIFPNWASDQLHHSLSFHFLHLSQSIQGCVEGYFTLVSEKEKLPTANLSGCKSVLNSKSKDESLANFAKWEPWHGKFGPHYPWGKYLQIGDLLRELAATTFSLQICLQSPRQESEAWRESIKEASEAVGSSLAWTLKELGESFMKMRRCQAETLIIPKLKTVRQEMSLVMSPSKLGLLETGDRVAVAGFVFLMMEMVEKVEELAKEVEELSEVAGFIL